MTKQKHIAEQIQDSLDAIYSRLQDMKSALEEIDVDEITLGDALEVVTKTKDELLVSVVQADEAVGTMSSLVEDADILDVNEEQERREHLLRALKHLGVTDLQRFTDAEMRMAMEATEGL